MKILTSTLFVISLSSPLAVAAENRSRAVATDDICAIRPDMCGSSAIKKKKLARQKKCRKPGESYSLNDSNLPLCGSTLRRAPASIINKRVSFSSYMNSNANHPALGGRAAGRQEAFIPPTRTAIYVEAIQDGQSVREPAPEN